jgi:hypothetical protein
MEIDSMDHARRAVLHGTGIDLMHGFGIVRWKAAGCGFLPLVEGETVLWWLGRAGFAARHGHRHFLIFLRAVHS